jgi:hypothetical protein
MRLDHISYVTTHNQLAETVQRLGARIESTFVDGGIHPRFGTRNFTAALKNAQYIEVVCPLDHPATEQTPWGRAVSQKADEGGGWFTWVFSTKDIEPIAAKFGRESIEGHRTRPNGSDLKWKQIGVKEIAESPEFPFFIQWLTSDHPSQDGAPVAEIKKIVISDENKLEGSWFKEEILKSISPIRLEWAHPKDNDNQKGILSIELETPVGPVVLD